jgi:hypothetical protein
VNCGDFDGKLDDEIRSLSGVPSSIIKEHTLQHGIILDDSFLVGDDIVVNIAINRGKKPDIVTSGLVWNVSQEEKAVIDFYSRIQPQSLKELGQKLRGQLTAKKFGM